MSRREENDRVPVPLDPARSDEVVLDAALNAIGPDLVERLHRRALTRGLVPGAPRQPDATPAPSSSAAVGAPRQPDATPAPSTSAAVGAPRQPDATPAPSTSAAVGDRGKPDATPAPSTSAAVGDRGKPDATPAPSSSAALNPTAKESPLAKRPCFAASSFAEARTLNAASASSSSDYGESAPTTSSKTGRSPLWSTRGRGQPCIYIPAPSSSRDGNAAPVPSSSRGGFNSSRGGYGGPGPSSSRGGFNSSRGGPGPSSSRGGFNSSRGGYGGPGPSSSRGGFNSSRGGYGGPGPSSSRGGFNSTRVGYGGPGPSSSRGGSGGFGSSKPSTSYERIPLPYTLAGPNQYQPSPKRGRYDAYPTELEPTGAQIFGSVDKDAQIRKMELHFEHVLVIDTCNFKQKILWQTLETRLRSIKAADTFSISSFSIHAEIVDMIGWTEFLKSVKRITIDGLFNAALVTKLFSRLPKSLTTLVFLPTERAIDMRVQEAMDRIPQSVQHLVFDTLLFREGDLVTTVAMLPVKKDFPFLRLVLSGHRFPSRGTLQAFYNRLEAAVYPGGCATLLTTNTPNDDVIVPLHEWGFTRSYLHRRRYGNLYEMYRFNGVIRCLVGFLVPNVPVDDPDQDEDDWY